MNNEKIHDDRCYDDFKLIIHQEGFKPKEPPFKSRGNYVSQGNFVVIGIKVEGARGNRAQLLLMWTRAVREITMPLVTEHKGFILQYRKTRISGKG